MNVELGDIGDAARLIGRALDVRAVIGADAEYATLVSRYRIDDQFRETVDTICIGLGLVPFGAVDQGLIVVPEADSVFSLGGIDAFEPGLTPQQRVVSGLVHLAIATVGYPRAEDLDRSAIVRVRVSQVERVLRDAARVVREHADEHDEALAAAFADLDAMPPRKPRGERRSRQTSLGLIRRAFERLADHGCARLVGDRDDDPEYQLLERYRLQVGDLAVIDAWEVLRSALDPSTAEDSVEEPSSSTTHDGAVPEEHPAESAS